MIYKTLFNSFFIFKLANLFTNKSNNDKQDGAGEAVMMELETRIVEDYVEIDSEKPDGANPANKNSFFAPCQVIFHIIY